MRKRRRYASGGRTYNPLAGDALHYGEGPEHEFFSGNLPAAQVTGYAPSTPTIPIANDNSTGSKVAGAVATAAKLADLYKKGSSLYDSIFGGGSLSGVGNADYLNDAVYGKGQDFNSWINNEMKPDSNTGSTPDTSAGSGSSAGSVGTAAGLGAGAGALASGLGAGTGVTATITPELIGAGEGALAATTGGAGAASGAAGALGGETAAGAGAGAGSGAAAAAPLGATAAGAAILAAAAMGIYGGDQRGNAINKSMKNQQARDSLQAYLEQRDSLGRMPVDPASASLPAWLQPETTSGYSDYFKLPSDVTADQFRSLPLEDQQRYAEQWANDTGGNFMTGKVEGTSYDQSGGVQLSQRQKDISKYGVLSSGYQTPEYGSDAYNAIMASVLGPGGGMAEGGYFSYGPMPPDLSADGVQPAPQPLAQGGPPMSPMGVDLSNQSRYMHDGPGSGRGDEIDAKLSPKEYVMDAETVALLGDGNPDHGAKKLDEMRRKIRMHKGKKLAKGQFSHKAKNPEAYL